MLETEPDGIKSGDTIIVPPSPKIWGMVDCQGNWKISGRKPSIVSGITENEDG